MRGWGRDKNALIMGNYKTYKPGSDEGGGDVAKGSEAEIRIKP